MDVLKKRVVGRAIQFHENEMTTGNYLQAARESCLLAKDRKSENPECFGLKQVSATTILKEVEIQPNVK